MQGHVHSAKKSFTQDPEVWHPAAFKLGGVEFPLSLLSKPFYLSASQSVFSDDLQRFVILPTHKWGSLSSADDLSHINKTSFILKVFESLMRGTISDHLSSNNCLQPSHYQFLKCHSSSFCQLDFFHRIPNLRDSGHLTIVVYFDFDKAFDKVSYKLLLYRAWQNRALAWRK